VDAPPLDEEPPDEDPPDDEPDEELELPPYPYPELAVPSTVQAIRSPADRRPPRARVFAIVQAAMPSSRTEVTLER
jgi:hypothetical protein